ncbi:MAG TPA: Gfo/Idh/MocA family oxidoreductase [Rubrivivax sp.]|nr:Gfo/Idh/MocA family oxidoreductase [Rubrivivax sp.]
MDKRVVMVGAGYWAQFQLEAWCAAGTPVVALCNRSAARAELLAARFAVPRCHTNLMQMLDEAKPTLLDVVLPPEAQWDAVSAALQRRIPVICQKPFGLNLAQAQAMAALARQQATPLVVHENFRFAPWFRECRRLIDNGFFGRVHGIGFRLRPGDGQGPRAYLERQPYFQSMPQFLVRETAVHFIDTFRYLLGEVDAVSARLRRLNPAIVGEDCAHIVFEFGDGRTGLFDGNRLNDHVADNPLLTMGEMWLEGERGVLRLDGQARLWFKPHGGAEAEHPYGGLAPGAFGGACTALQKHVLAHLREGAPLENTAADYLANLQVQAAVYHSHATGTRVVMSQFTPHDNPEWRMT